MLRFKWDVYSARAIGAGSRECLMGRSDQERGYGEDFALWRKGCM